MFIYNNDANELIGLENNKYYLYKWFGRERLGNNLKKSYPKV